jgi:hypothetical protein
MDDIVNKIRTMKDKLFDKNGRREWTFPNNTWKDTFANILFSRYPEEIIINSSKFVIAPGFDGNSTINLEDVKYDETTLKEMYLEYFTEIERLKESKCSSPQLVEHLKEYTTIRNVKLVQPDARIDFDTDRWYLPEMYWEKGIPSPLGDEFNLPTDNFPLMFIEIEIGFE